MFFSVITKNSNWKILTNNLFTLKKKRWVKDEKVLVFKVVGDSQKKNNIEGRLPQKGDACTVCRFNGRGGALQERGSSLPQYILWSLSGNQENITFLLTGGSPSKSATVNLKKANARSEMIINIFPNHLISLKSLDMIESSSICYLNQVTLFLV